MNTNSNAYTIVYTSAVVVLVAIVLAAVSMSLKPMQDANVKAEAVSQMLTAAQYGTKDELTAQGNDKVLDMYRSSISDAFVINVKGERLHDLDKESVEVFSDSDLKAQNSARKVAKDAEGLSGLELPVYVFDKDGQDVTIIPIYGAGLWGPVWGYLALEPDLSTIVGAYFDHGSETPGLGAKIKDDPDFRAQFSGKKIDFATGGRAFDIIKGGAPKGQLNAVDAITGATMTSNGLRDAITDWLDLYKAYLTKAEE